MRDRIFERHINTMLRDDLLAQLRTASRPMSTSELRVHAPEQPPWPGAAHRYRPSQEQVYRVLCRLERHGAIIRHDVCGRTVKWSAAPTDDDAEIAILERAFHGIAADTSADPLVRHTR